MLVACHHSLNSHGLVVHNPTQGIETMDAHIVHHAAAGRTIVNPRPRVSDAWEAELTARQQRCPDLSRLNKFAYPLHDASEAKDVRYSQQLVLVACRIDHL